MNIPDDIFRGYDLRGLVDVELSPELYEVLGKAYAVFLSRLRIREAVVGMDCRLTSLEYKDAFIKGLIESGIDVIDIGLTLTQIFYFSQYHYLSKGGAMVTASHNPKEFNGLKLAVGYSDTMVTEEIQELKNIAKQGKFIENAKPGLYRQDDVFPYYKKDILKLFPEKLNFKVVVDASKGTAGKFLPEVLRGAGCEVIEQNTDIDGNFPLGVPDPTEREVQERLAEGVVKNGADLGFSYDGDGDRVGIVDSKGNLLWNDNLVSIFAMDLLDFMPNAKIIFNVLCSKQTTDVINAKGGQPVMWKTGHSFIKAKVKEERAMFGGELSGHFFFMDNFYGHDDSAMASLRLLSYLQRTNQTLGQLISTLPKYISSPEIKVDCPDSIKFSLIDGVITDKLKAMYPNETFTSIDGIRMDAKDQMIVIRASQNGPYITVKFEGRTQDEYDQAKRNVVQILSGLQDVDITKGNNIDSLAV